MAKLLREVCMANEKLTTPQPLPKQKKLIYMLLTVMLSIAVIPLVVTGLNLMKINKEFLENELLLLHTQLANDTAEKVSIRFENIRRRLLIFYLERYPNILNLAILNKSGREEVQAYRTIIKINDKSIINEERDIGVKRALHGEIFIGDTHVSSDLPESFLAIYLPIKNDIGQIANILKADINLKDISIQVDMVNIRKDGFAYLVNRKGQLITHKDKQRVRSQENMSDIEIVGKYLAVGKTGGAIPFKDKDGKEMLGAYATVKNLGWGVIVQEPKSDAYLSVRTMTKTTTLWGILTIILASTIAVFFSNRISIPIQKLADSSLSIAKGNFKERIDIPAKNEIGQLARTFNYMAEKLDEYSQDMRDLFVSTIKSLAAAIDAKDPYTHGHSERVAAIATMIAKEFGLSPQEIEMINIAALLHDVGKIGIDDHLLRGAMITEEQYNNIIKQHPQLGASIMAPIKQLKKIIPGAKYHHERFDGKGYPDGLSGKDIPLVARIIALADTYDAMTSDRPYQKAMNQKSVVEKIKEWSGSRFDPEIVKAFASALEKERPI
ncbi:MAG: HD domain-containing protein [Nitrospirae bacterium]|nr:HD domain-containing protein [Nitrospirota bacterium]